MCSRFCVRIGLADWLCIACGVPLRSLRVLLLRENQHVAIPAHLLPITCRLTLATLPLAALLPRPTLKRLPKTLPVVASASGAAVARSLGFRSVTTLDHGQTLTLLDGRLTIQGTAGALVGPPWSKRELGVVLRENLEGGGRGASLYYEPHADYQPDSVEQAVAKGGPVDVVVSPPCSQSLFGYPLVRAGIAAGDCLRACSMHALCGCVRLRLNAHVPHLCHVACKLAAGCAAHSAARSYRSTCAASCCRSRALLTAWPCCAC